MAAHPRRKCFTRQVLRDINKIAAFASKIENFCNVDVPQLLRGGYLFLELLAHGGIDALHRDQL